jgi:hypothetical protein
MPAASSARGLLAAHVLVREVREDEVVVGAAGDERDAARRERLGQGPGVVDDLLRVDLEVGLEGLVRRDREAGDRAVVRTALEAREHGLVDRARVLGGGEDHAAARTTQRLVRGRGDDVREADRARVRAARDEARDVRDVGREHGADVTRDLRERGEVDRARIGRRAAPDQLGLVLLRERGDLIHVDAVVALAHAVLVRREEVAGDRDLPAVREVAAGGEAEADRRVAGA